MNVVIVGNGGREASLAWRFAQSPSLGELHVLAPNPSWPAQVVVHEGADCLSICREHGISLVVVGPEQPLADGLADQLREEGFAVFGPGKEAARLESSKSFSKEMMTHLGIPTAEALICRTDSEEGVSRARVRCSTGQVVIKADGLAAGKGVYVCKTPEEALSALDEVVGGRFGAASDTIVLEDMLDGPEVSVFGISDGVRVVGLPSAQDHKRLADGDHGPNTGGMGAYAPCKLLSDDQVSQVIQQVHQPIVDECARRGFQFQGVLYAGLMMTSAGPRVLEFNVRFGDPECQALMMLWKEDVLPWFYGAATGKLPPGAPSFSSESACCLVLASPGYPRSSTKGLPIPVSKNTKNCVVFAAGAKVEPSGWVTNGGRVLGITARGATLSIAREEAYTELPKWLFEGAQYRSDIGLKGL